MGTVVVLLLGGLLCPRALASPLLTIRRLEDPSPPLVTLNFTLTDNGVEQLHLAQGKDPTNMTVSWLTEDTKSPTKVVYGLSPEALNLEASSEDRVKYTFPDKGSEYESGLIHHVPLTGLSPSTTYYYRAGQAEGIHSFTTLPEVGKASRLVFGVLADLGQTEDSLRTVEHMLRDTDVQMVLHAGDAGYADCRPKLWDTYMRMLEPLAAEVPWMISPGNHEVEWTDKRRSIFTAFDSRYRMPWVLPPLRGAIPVPPNATDKPQWACTPSVYQAEMDYGNYYWSFDAGRVHVIFLNTYSYTNTTSRQYQWLEKDLKSVDRGRLPWVLVFMHCPWYNTNRAHWNEAHTLNMTRDMEPLLYSYHVNVVVAGHVHAYERTVPVFQNQPRQDGIVYLNIGDAGNAEGHASKYNDTIPAWSAFRNGTQYGHARLVIEDDQKLTWEWHRNVDGEPVVKDQITVCNTVKGLRADCQGRLTANIAAASKRPAAATKEDARKRLRRRLSNEDAAAAASHYSLAPPRLAI